MPIPRFAIAIFSTSLVVFGLGPAYGQAYPNKPIRIVTSAAGGGSDRIARLSAQGISSPLAQQVVVENRGSSRLSAEIVAKSLPDGYTLLLGGASLWIGPLLRTEPYAIADFSPISLISRDINIVAVHPSVAARSVKELVALARSRPGELNYASTAVGGSPHLAGELFKSMAGVNIVLVAYKGTAQSATALIAGEMQMTISDFGLVEPHVRSGKLRGLAVTSAEPSTLAPNMPTVAASGVPGYEAVGMTGLWAPAKTPPTIINRLNQEIVRVLNKEDAKEKIFGMGSEIVNSSPAQFAAAVKSDVARMGKVIKDAGIKAD